MRMIDLDTHSALDYTVVAAALLAPYILGFSKNKKAQTALQGIFLASVAKDLCTRYKYSLVKKIPIGIHLSLDMAVGTATAAAPFVLGFHKELKPWQTAFFLVVGLGVFPFVAMTHPYTEFGKRRELELANDKAEVESLAM
jgi:hypothetical protein